MYCDIRLRIIDPENINTKHYGLGPGLVMLLEEIEKTNSVKGASEKLKMSLSKCWKILKTSEKTLGKKLVISTPGGINGGKTVLSDYSKTVIKIFRQVEDKCFEVANSELDKFSDQF